MKISELMDRLGELQGIHGDIEVMLWDSEDIYPMEVTEAVFETFGNQPIEYIQLNA